MTRFEEVLQEHEKEKLQKIAAEKAQAKKEEAERNEFSRQFLAAIAATAKPIFTEFANEARRHGFPSAVEDGYDQHGNPYLQVRFFPERYVVSSVDTSRDCAFVLMADLAEQHVIAGTRFHPWPEKDSTHKVTFTKRTLSATTLNRLLYEFMRIALDARDEN